MVDYKEALESPVFIVGSVRSGTTLLRLMLDHHPNISFYSEFEYIVDKISDSGFTPQLDDYYKFLESHIFFKNSKFTINKKLNYTELVTDFLRQKIKSDEKQFVGATVHYHFDRLLYIWPKARFIHIVRDPRDVASSVVAMGWAGNIWKGAETWVTAEILWDNMVHKLDKKNYVEVKYEELIQDTEAQLSKVCDFIGTPYNKDMMSYAEKSTYELPNPDILYRWKKKPDNSHVRLVESKCSSLITDRGYQLSGLPISNIKLGEAIWLKIDNKLKKWSFRVKRYGFWLLLSKKIVAIFKLKFFYKYFQDKYDRISAEYIK